MVDGVKSFSEVHEAGIEACVSSCRDASLK